MMSKLLLAMVLLVPFASRVSAECSNGCSGHGRCTNYKMTFTTASDANPSIKMPTYGYATGDFGWDITIPKKDSCTCFTRKENALTVYAFQGADCSQRTCAYGQSWDSSPHATDAHTLQTECSNRGTCDRKTGECKCAVGYTGKSCQRTTCPNDCSGRGSCLSLREIAENRAADSASFSTLVGYSYASIQYGTAWDADRIKGCECDLGYRGADCSETECPSTTDPMGGLGSESGRECSGRGKCNFENGVCKCHAGFFGTKCEQQRANVL